MSPIACVFEGIWEAARRNGGQDGRCRKRDDGGWRTVLSVRTGPWIRLGSWRGREMSKKAAEGRTRGRYRHVVTATRPRAPHPQPSLPLAACLFLLLRLTTTTPAPDRLVFSDGPLTPNRAPEPRREGGQHHQLGPLLFLVDQDGRRRARHSGHGRGHLDGALRECFGPSAVWG